MFNTLNGFNSITSYVAGSFNTTSLAAVELLGVKGSYGEASMTYSNSSESLGLKSSEGNSLNYNILSYNMPAEKITSATLEVSPNSSLSTLGLKNSLGNINIIHNVTTTSTGLKVVAGIAQGTLEIDLVHTATVSGYKNTLGTSETNLSTSIIIDTIKLIEDRLVSLASQSMSTTGEKSVSKAINISGDSILSILQGEKVATGSVVLGVDGSNIIVEGMKHSSATLSLDIGEILTDLLAQTMRSGDLESYNVIAGILSGVNTESTHIARANTILGTVNIRYNAIIGTI